VGIGGLPGVGGGTPGGPEGPRETRPDPPAGPDRSVKGPSAVDKPGRTAPPSFSPVTSLLNALKLPPGPWSASILSYAKFFSLPLESAFLGKIRQQVLRAEPGRPEGSRSPAGEALPPAGEGRGGNGTEALFREALSLAALAAAAKGVEASPEALAEYARALLRGRRRGETSPQGEGADSGAGDRDSGEKPEAGGGGIPGKGAGGRRAKDPAEGGEAGEESGESPGKGAAGRALRERVLAAQGPLLGLLNKLPGKGGTRWVVLPFSLDNGLEGCLRILLRPLNGVPAEGGTAGRMAAERLGLDLRYGEESWTFTLWAEPAGLSTARPSPAGAPIGDPAGIPSGAPAAGPPAAESSPTRGSPAWPSLSLEVSRCPPFRPGEGESLGRELAGLLGLAPGKPRIRGEFPPLAEDSRDWTLPSLDKEV
jgi:hypothetical protein